MVPAKLFRPVVAWITVCAVLAATAGCAATAEEGKASRSQGDGTIDSSPEVVEAGRAAAREAAVSGMLSGRVLRVEAAGAAVAGPRLGSYLVRPDTERSIPDAVLADLTELMKSPGAFDDRIVKRCRSGVSVGFRLSRSPDAGFLHPDSEFVLDFGCNRLAIGIPRVDARVQASYFDPSRSAFVRLVKRSLPGDPEVQGLVGE